MYSVFGDESHDELRARVFAVAGLFGNEQDWAEATENWLSRTGGMVFHATDCDSDTGEFHEFTHWENKRLYRDLTRIIADSRLMGFGAAVSIPDYDRVFGDSVDYKPYHFCFLEVVTHFARIAYTCIPQAQAKYTFEHNNKVQYDAASVYRYALGLTEWQFHKYLHPDGVSFAFRDNPSIQMADLLARESMKHLDNQLGPVYRRTRGAYRALCSTGRFVFHFFLGDYFEDLRRRSGLVSEGRRGRTQDEYMHWRGSYGLPDTVSTRIRYQAFLDQLDRGEGRTPSVLLSRHEPPHT